MPSQWLQCVPNPQTQRLTPNTVELIPTRGALSPRGGPVQDPVLTPPSRCRTKREPLQRFYGLSPESQGQSLALTVVYVPYSLDSGYKKKRLEYNDSG